MRSCTTPQENQHTSRNSSQSTERLARLVVVCGSKRTGEVEEFRRSHVVPFARVSLLPSSTKQRSSNQTSPLSFFRAHHERDNRSQNAPHFHPHDIQSQVSFRRQPASQPFHSPTCFQQLRSGGVESARERGAWRSVSRWFG
jgi:hypothetical protein